MKAAPLLLAVLLAGCTDAPAPVVEEVPVARIAGTVFDVTFRPIEGALVSLGGTELFSITDSDGAFFIEAPAGAPVYALRIEAFGFHDATLVLEPNSTTPRFDEDITLVRLPVAQPFQETQPWTGNLACSWFAQAQHSHGGPGDPGAHNANDCSSGTNDEVWTFDLKPGVRNVVIEAHWEPNSIASDRLAIFVEGPGLDNGGDALFYFNEGPTNLRAGISQLQANTYYREEGGEVRVTVKIGAPEDDIAAGVAINQEFTVYATAFYVLPGPSDYSILEEP